MCSDRGVATDLRPEELDPPRGSTGCTHLHVSGYALLREPVGSAARERSPRRARRGGT